MTDQSNVSAQLTTPAVSAKGNVSDPLYSLLCQAVDERATDIHFDPLPDGKLVRFRVDGIVFSKTVLREEEHKRVLKQVKVAAGFSIGRSFVPEEGMILLEHQEHEQPFSIRVSTVPSGHDRVAIHFRFISGNTSPPDFSELGMSEKHQEQMKTVLQSPMGIILIAGMTGSGKSSTLYAIANALDLESSIGVSIEDPIEMRIKGLRQIEVDSKHDFDMYEGLRTTLRMDPDSIFIGEIRDTFSAVTSARAGLAGRLVVSTVHAPNPATAIEALHHYEVPPYITASAMRLIITQYLLRRLCSNCKNQRSLGEEERQMFISHLVDIPEKVFDPVGCEKCHDYGYLGRIGVFELTSVNAEVAHDISARLEKVKMLERLRQYGGPSFMVDALEKAASGSISMVDVQQLSFNVERQ